MRNSIITFPLPANEPVKSYLAGSPERIALEAELERQSNIVVDIPIIIGGKEIRTGNTDNQTAVGTSDLDSPQWLMRGNIFGAGAGMGTYSFDLNGDDDTDDDGETGFSTSAGSVTRFSQVDYLGGILHRNIYGGGSLASVGPPKIPPITIDAYKKGDTDPDHGPGKQSMCTVNVSGSVGTPVDFNEFYGGEVYGASRGSSALDPEQFSTCLWTQVNILKGARIMNNVFGGGDAGKVKKDTEVNVGVPPAP